jgi:signal transduction histidine kinase
MDGIRMVIREMKEEETAALQQRYQEMQASVRGTLHTLGVGSLLGLTLLILASCVIHHDIAKRQRAEVERARLETALRRSEKMSAMGALVAGVAHQVRNPLFAMSSTLDALEAHFGVAREYQTYINVLRIEVERLVKLMRQLLDYGKPNLEFFPSALEDVLAEAVTACQPLAQSSHVILSSQIPPALPPVLVERERLLQVFQNLLENAIQHSPTAGAVQVKARQAGEAGKVWLDCVVEDAGPGFRPEALSHIFEPFFSQRPGGTGLGLSIVQRIVEGYGGTIIAENRAEGGAVIVVRLPIANERSSGSQGHASYGQEQDIGRR